MNEEDLSNIFEKFNINKDSINPDMVNNLMEMLNDKNSYNSSENNNENSNYDSTNNTSGIDFDTILKMKNIIDKINSQDDPRSNLLQSLKPYLNETRKSKVDQYIQLMNMSKIMDIFPFWGGDNTNANK